MKRTLYLFFLAAIAASPFVLVGCDGDLAPDTKYTVSVIGVGAEPIKTWNSCTNITYVADGHIKLWCKGKYIELFGHPTISVEQE